MVKEQEVMVENEEIVAPAEKKETAESYQEEATPVVDAMAPKRKSNASVPVDKFDWDSFEEDTPSSPR